MTKVYFVVRSYETMEDAILNSLTEVKKWIEEEQLDRFGYEVKQCYKEDYDFPIGYLMTVEERIAKVKEMNEAVMQFNDEDNIFAWLECGVPDCPCEEDFKWFAEDLEEFTNLIRLYERLKKAEKRETLPR